MAFRRVVLVFVLLLLLLSSVAVSHGAPVNNATWYGLELINGTSSPPRLTSPPSAQSVVLGRSADLSQLQAGGMTVLHVKPGPAAAATPEDEMWATGYIEGALTVNQTWVFLDNFGMYELWPVLRATGLYTWYETNWAWVAAQIDAHAPHDAYWARAQLLRAQLRGLVAGYNDAIGSALWHIDEMFIVVLNALAELPDVASALEERWPAAVTALLERARRLPHCSALLKPVDGGDVLVASHTTWSSYTLMDSRVWKRVTARGGATVSFSSYPLYVYSMDDFYTRVAAADGAVMVVTETTNNQYNNALWARLTPNGTVCTFMRAALATRFAESSAEWASEFSKLQSGTYNCQWMAYDFSSKSLHVVETAPGLVHAADLTAVLHKQGYWPSYNIPYFEDIFNATQQPVPYDECPRARIFRRDHGKVVDVPSMEAFIRENRYKTDPLSNGDPVSAVASRFDLADKEHGGDAYGAIDAKVTSVAMRGAFRSVCGPTFNDEVPAFSWLNTSYASAPHKHQRDVWTAQWTTCAFDE